MLKSKTLGHVAVMLGVAVASAQADDLGAIQKKLASEYAVTQPTADNTDIVTAGSILILQKSGLMLSPTTNTTLDQNTYRDGTIQAGAATKTKSFLHKFGSVPGISSVPGVGTVAGTAATADSSSGGASRTYVTGEKIWVTKVEVKTEGKDQEAVFTLFTDAVSDVRYRGTLKFLFRRDRTTIKSTNWWPRFSRFNPRTIRRPTLRNRPHPQRQPREALNKRLLPR